MGNGGDVLARGGKKAAFRAAGSTVGEEIVFRNKVVAEETNPEYDQEPLVNETFSEAPKKPRKRYRPRGEELLVRRATAEELSQLVVRPDSVDKEEPAEGIVLEVGPEVWDIHKGDQIVFGKYAGQEFRLNGESLLLMAIKDVKGIIEVEE